MVLGEAANRLSEAFRGRRSQIPWRLMIGMRNRLIHGYDEVDMEEVWNTAERDVPSLLVALASLDPEAL